MAVKKGNSRADSLVDAMVDHWVCSKAAALADSKVFETVARSVALWALLKESMMVCPMAGNLVVEKDYLMGFVKGMMTELNWVASWVDQMATQRVWHLGHAMASKMAGEMVCFVVVTMAAARAGKWAVSRAVD